MNDLLTVLTWLHIFFVIGWFGSFLYVLFTLFPMLPKLTPQLGKEFMFKLLPSHELFTILFATGTILAGVLLFLEMKTGQSYAWFSYIWPGMLAGLTAYILVFVAMLSFHKMKKALGSIINQPQVAMSPPPKSTIVLIIVSLVLLIFAMSFMVLAASV